jgi:hypothetical protein
MVEKGSWHTVLQAIGVGFVFNAGIQIFYIKIKEPLKNLKTCRVPS